MGNQTMLSTTLGFHKTAFANTLAILATMQKHGEDLLKTTFEQSPWLPESSKKACLFWADVCTKNLQTVKDLVDRNLSEMEGLSFAIPKTHQDQPPQKPANRGRISSPRPVEKIPVEKIKVASQKKITPEKQVLAEKPAPEENPVVQPVTASAATAIFSKPEPIITVTVQPTVIPTTKGDTETT